MSAAPDGERLQRGFAAGLGAGALGGTFGFWLQLAEALSDDTGSMSAGGGPMLPDEWALVVYQAPLELLLTATTAAGAATLGLGAHWLLMRQGWTSLPAYLTVGCLVTAPLGLAATAAMALVYCMWGCDWAFLRGIVWPTPVGFFIGVLAGATTFWLVRRPDRAAGPQDGKN